MSLDTSPDWLAPYIERCMALIAAQGHMVQSAGGGPGGPGMCYTVGLSIQPGLGYELAISGLPPDAGASVLKGAVRELRERGIEPTEGLTLTAAIEGYSARLRAAHTLKRFGIIPSVTGSHCPVWQVVWPDRDHHFPGEPGYSIPPDGQDDLSIPAAGYSTIPARRPWENR
jgi:hypothetical protein